jgi:hypothetical protein
MQAWQMLNPQRHRQQKGNSCRQQWHCSMGLRRLRLLRLVGLAVFNV